MRAFTSLGESGSGGSLRPLLAGTWSMSWKSWRGPQKLRLISLSMKSASLLLSCLPTRTTSKKGNYSEKMGALLDGAKMGRLHALLPDGPGRDCGGSRKGP